MSTNQQENKEMETTSWEESGMMDYIPLTREDLDQIGEPREELTPEQEAEADY